MKLILIALATLLAAPSAIANASLRWTYQDDREAGLAHIVAAINERTGYSLTEADFSQTEDRDLAYNHYRRYDQMRDGTRIAGLGIRVWTTLHGGNPQLIQLEAEVDAPAVTSTQLTRARRSLATDPAPWAETLARKIVDGSDDALIQAVSHETTWQDGRLLRTFNFKARRGRHRVSVDLQTQQVVSRTYAEFPQADYQIPALVYPIYEEYGGQMQPRQRVMLKHLLSEIKIPDSDPYAPLRDRTYYYKKLDDVQGNTPEGQAQGYWSLNWLQTRATDLTASIPLAPNTPDTGHALLQGRYVTINIHPDAMTAFRDIWIPKRLSTRLYFTTKRDEQANDYLVIPGASYFGKPLENRTDALHRDASRHPTHDPAYYINRGFDEVQAYYAVNELFERLRPLGFKDPELSTRTFDAYLYDPDIASMNNAYYDSDTINFTTYSPKELNMARDNTTVWHELGHGVMDRLMGTRLDLADTGGLSEGMADFIAELVLRATNHNLPFPGQMDQRIINATAFFLTNEVHDDGEAYGGTMKAILDAATTQFGEDKGLAMVTDLVLEAMRLSRDNPHLTAQDWFDHVLFADELGRRNVRAPGELAELIRGALAARNFADETTRAGFSLSYDGKPVIAGEPGSRGHEIKTELHAGEQKTFSIDVSLHDGAAFKFHYPVQVKIFFNSGALQGAIDWQGEDQEPTVLTINASGETLSIPLTINGTCDASNRSDGSCSDYAYVQIYNPGDDRPIAKKRFYLQLKPQSVALDGSK